MIRDNRKRLFEMMERVAGMTINENLSTALGQLEELKQIINEINEGNGVNYLMEFVDEIEDEEIVEKYSELSESLYAVNKNLFDKISLIDKSLNIDFNNYEKIKGFLQNISK